MRLAPVALASMIAAALCGCDKGQVSIHGPGVSITSSGTHFEVSGDVGSGKFLPVSGPTSSEERTVPAFHAISADGIIEVKFVKGDHSSVSVSARQSLLSHLETKVEHGTLKMQMQGNVQDPGPIIVSIVNPTLDSVEATGSSSVSCSGLKEPSLNVKSYGGATVSLEGTADQLHLELSGSCHFSAPHMGDVVLNGSASGASEAEITGRVEDADFSVSGSGNLKLQGAQATHLKFQIEGGSKVDAQGTTDRLEVTCTGSGEAEMSDLVAKECRASAEGGSQLHLNVVNTLKADASGGSQISYKGTPSSLTRTATGGAQISSD